MPVVMKLIHYLYNEDVLSAVGVYLLKYILQEFGCSKSHHMPVVMKLIHYLYNEDVLSEDAIMQ